MNEIVSRRNTLAAAAALGAGFAKRAAAEPGKAPSTIYDVKQFGASGNKTEKATKSFQSAVNAASAAGGGVVQVSPGEYTCGPVEVKSNVTIHLDAGATILVSRDASDFPPRGAGQDRPHALFYATNVENIAFTGMGKIDGQATWEWRYPAANDYTTSFIPHEVDLAKQAGLDMRFWFKTGPVANMFSINRAKNVLIEGIRTVNCSEWCMRLVGIDGLFVRGVHLYSDLDRAVNSDGIDLVSCKNVMISDCLLVTADDCISLKTMKGGEPVENVTITNCVISSSSSGLVIGVETWADMHHVIFSNSVIRNSNRGFRIAVENGGSVHDVIFSNLTIDLSRRHWNWWGNAETFQFQVKQETPDSPMGSIRNVIVENILSQARGTSTILGPVGQSRIEDISISNLRTLMIPENTADKRVSHALHVQGVRGFKLRDFSVKWDEEKPEPKWQSAIYLNDVHEFEIDGFNGRQGLKSGGAPAIMLEDVSDGAVRDSRAAAACGTFVAVRGQKTKRLFIYANNTANAASKADLQDGMSQQAVSFNQPA
jgi:hypothetical protein